MSNFVPEMHDIGKLIPSDVIAPLTEGNALRSHDREGPSFRNLDWQELGESAPDNATWLAIAYHMYQGAQWVRDLRIAPDIVISDEDRFRLFLVVVSDHLAATAGRVLETGGSGKATEVYRLWQPKYSQTIKAEAEPIKDVGTLRQMIQWIRSDPGSEGEFDKRYGASLRRKPEDESIPRNVTSLHSHLWLTGKFYRVLGRYAVLKTDPLRVEFGGQAASTTHDAEQLWECCLVRAVVCFYQQPVRPADLGIFERLNDAHTEFAKKFADNLLFAAGDNLWLFLPSQTLLALNQVFEPYINREFYVTAEILQAPLQDLRVWRTPEAFHDTIQRLGSEQANLTRRSGELPGLILEVENEIQKTTARIRAVTTESSRKPLIEHNQELSRRRSELQAEQRQSAELLEKIKKEISDLGASSQSNLIHTSLHSDSLVESFEPPLCEVCQVRRGRPIRFGNRTDYLCTDCEEIRHGGLSQRKLADRLERDSAEAEDEKVSSRARYLWLRIALLGKEMEGTVAALFGEYVDSIPGLDPARRLPLKTHLRLPSLLRDFVDDYLALLACFNEALLKLPDVTALTSAFWVVPLESGDVIKKVLADYLNSLRQFFPKFLDEGQGAPCIRLSGSIAPAVMPFYEHWRYVQNPTTAINLRVMGSAQLEIGLSAAEALLREMESGGNRQQSFLHRVAAIERATQSKFMVQAAFMDEEGRSDPARGKPLLPAITLYKSGAVAAAEILAYHKLTNWR